MIYENFINFNLIFCSAISFGGTGDDGQVLVDNDKLKVVKFTGEPYGNVCGIGTHFHKAHLTVALTDAKVLITSPDGKQQEVEIPAEAAVWFDAGSHAAINSGDKPTKFLLIYLK